jgi:hypothetical protein
MCQCTIDFAALIEWAKGTLVEWLTFVALVITLLYAKRAVAHADRQVEQIDEQRHDLIRPHLTIGTAQFFVAQPGDMEAGRLRAVLTNIGPGVARRIRVQIDNTGLATAVDPAAGYDRVPAIAPGQHSADLHLRVPEFRRVVVDYESLRGRRYVLVAEMQLLQLTEIETDDKEESD